VRHAEQCLRRLAQVREAAEDIRSAYVYRTRLHRLLVSLGRAMEDEFGAAPLPSGVFGVSDEWPAATQRVAMLWNAIFLDSRHLSQRSESFDARWRAEWRDMAGKLDALEGALRAASGHSAASAAQV